MPQYDHGDPPQDTADVLRFLREELTRIEAFTQSPEVREVQLVSLVAEPRKREGKVVFADGTHWNPGAGAGVYVYSGGAWVKL